MDKVEMDLSGDWDIVSSVCSGEKEKCDETTSENGSSNETACKFTADGAFAQDVVEHEITVGNESSSSDIDIIDENLDEIELSPKNCFLPSTLTISSSTEQIFDSSPLESSPSASDAITTAPTPSEESETKAEETGTNASNDDGTFWSWTVGGRRVEDWMNFLYEYVSNLTGIQLGCIFGLTFCLSLCISINTINIWASFHEKGTVVSQMEKLVDELRNDNKQLQEQMLSEMKNDKLVSSFEHQIRELKKENSKLNHMLYDVVKVLEKQKDTQEKLLEKKESEYQAPFKKEINKLREHINVLKFDNEELQKQLVRMRYSSYSQGSKHTNSKDHGKERNRKEPESGKASDMKDEKISGNDKKEEGDSSGEIPMDLNQLKRWNELLDLVAKELGIFDKTGSGKENPDSTSDEKSKWNWQDLKSKFKKPSEYVSGVASIYTDFYGKMINKLYKSASNYITDAQENVQSLFDSFQGEEEKSEQKFKMWNVINNLGEKWDQVKKKVLSTYNMDKFCPAGGDSGKADVSETVKVDPSIQETEENQIMEQLDTYYSSEQNKIPNDAENEKWFFKRANFREKLRENEKDESSVNWFLKKKRRDLLSEKAGKEDPINE